MRSPSWSCPDWPLPNIVRVADAGTKKSSVSKLLREENEQNRQRLRYPIIVIDTPEGLPACGPPARNDIATGSNLAGWIHWRNGQVFLTEGKPKQGRPSPNGYRKIDAQWIRPTRDAGSSENTKHVLILLIIIHKKISI